MQYLQTVRCCCSPPPTWYMAYRVKDAAISPPVHCRPIPGRTLRERRKAGGRWMYMWTVCCRELWLLVHNLSFFKWVSMYIPTTGNWAPALITSYLVEGPDVLSLSQQNSRGAAVFGGWKCKQLHRCLELFSITTVTPSCWNTVWYGTDFHAPLPLSFTMVLGTIHCLFWQSVCRNSWSCQSPSSGHKVLRDFFWKDLDLWKQNKNTFDIKSLNYKCECSCSKVLLVGRMNQTEITQKTM